VVGGDLLVMVPHGGAVPTDADRQQQLRRTAVSGVVTVDLRLPEDVTEGGEVDDPPEGRTRRRHLHRAAQPKDGVVEPHHCAEAAGVPGFGSGSTGNGIAWWAGREGLSAVLDATTRVVAAVAPKRV